MGMKDLKDLYVEALDEGLSDQEAMRLANERYIDQQASAFDRWKDEAKENGTYVNPLVRRD